MKEPELPDGYYFEVSQELGDWADRRFVRVTVRQWRSFLGIKHTRGVISRAKEIPDTDTAVGPAVWDLMVLLQDDLRHHLRDFVAEADKYFEGDPQ